MDNPKGDGLRVITPRSTGCYCINVRRAANILTKYYDRVFDPIQLTVSQFSLLSAVSSLKACNKSELAVYTQLDRTTIIRNLSVLTKKNLVAEVSGGGNLIHLTGQGETVLSKGRELWKQAQRQVEAAVGSDSMEDLLRILKRLEALDGL